ncbi:FecR domain-containing protein [Pseudomonas sp. RA_35y_Pfl2_P32]|uniref:FecR domain-containing protein n=1 Tax=Pseudomonas sp. RA_35y_Pfl2_P32 TaxID=3088705 RepID=UPI0030D812E6
MPTSALNKLSHASLQQAAHWYVQLNDQQVGEQERLRWQAWLAQSGEHQDAWRYVQRVGERFAPLQGDTDCQAASKALRGTGRTSVTRRQTLKSLLILTSGSLLGFSAWRQTSLPATLERWSADLSTGTGEVRESQLRDGSRVWLNALSALDVRFDSHQRLVNLRLGEILIDTAKDALRPFRVHTEQGLLQALGTRFSVRQDQDRTLLSVFEGAVQVRLANAQVQVVPAGRQLAFTQDRFEPQHAVSPAREAWRRGVLLADNLPLGQLLEELGRYRHGHLACDPAVAQMPVMGSFPLKDTDQALRLLAAALPITLEKPMPWWVNVGARS